MQTDNLRAVLKQSGYSLTKPRKLVFDLLLQGRPMSMSELVSESGHKVDRASIYRTVSLFEKLGITHRVNTGWKYKIELSDAFIGHHHHMHCTNCGQITTLPANTMLETMIDTTAAKEDFKPRSHQLEIYGICANCTEV